MVMPLSEINSAREIFGPLLPVIPYDDMEQAIRFVNSKLRIVLFRLLLPI